MNKLMMNLNIQANNRLLDKKSTKFTKTNKEDSFNRVLKRKMDEPKEDNLKTSKNKKTDLQRTEPKEIKKEKPVNESIDKEDIENIEKETKENMPEDIMELIASLNACIEELAAIQETAENSENTAIELEDIKTQLKEILSFIEKKNITDNVLSNEVLEQLKSKLEMLSDQRDVNLDLEDFNKLLSKLKKLLAVQNSNENETSSVVVGETVNKSDIDALHTKEDSEVDNGKKDVFQRLKSKSDTNTENERQMSQNSSNNEKFGFFANKSQKTPINDKIIQDIPTNYMIQNNMNEMEHIKLETTTVQKPNFQNILEQVVDKAQVIVDEKGSEMTLRLKPNHLGNLSMKIAVERGIVVANIVAENQVVKEVLESNFNVLRDALNEKGFGIQELNVSVGQDSDFQQQQNFMNFKKKNNGKAMGNSLEYENVVNDEQISNVSSMNESTIDQLG